jgi:hypothetical protein
MRHTGILIFLALLFPAILQAQEITTSNADITGLWKGTLYNDTTRTYYRYEIAISEEKKGKYTGYSHTWFLVDDQQYYGVKKIKIKRSGDKIITEDATLIANNYPEAPAKGVRQLNVLTLAFIDSLMVLNGPFSTNQTKIYSPLTGTIKLERRNDYNQSSLVPHLQELGLEKNLSFVRPIEPVKPAIDLATADGRVISPGITQVSPAPQTNQPEKELSLEKRDISYQASKSNNKAELPVDIKKKDIPVPVVNKPVDVPAGQTLVKKAATGIEAEKRVTVIQQVVSIKSDSLQLSLYDNGEVDGDTVSVLLNGITILERQGLSTRAVKKTIYLPKDYDSLQIVMYAETLGSIPPNTGLLVIRDGQDTYEIRFSGDLQKNAGILLRRRKP